MEESLIASSSSTPPSMFLLIRAMVAPFLCCLQFGIVIGYSSPAIPNMIEDNMLTTSTSDWFVQSESSPATNRNPAHPRYLVLNYPHYLVVNPLCNGNPHPSSVTILIYPHESPLVISWNAIHDIRLRYCSGDINAYSCKHFNLVKSFVN